MKRIRLHTLWLPPLGLWLLWRNRDLRWPRKLFGTVGIALYSIIYIAAVVALLAIGMKWEFRGGTLPYLTFRKTLPNYAALEASRRTQMKSASSATGTNAYWTGFRGPNQDGHYRQTPITPAPRLLWKQPIGGGYASFAYGEGRAFTIEQRRQNETAVAYDIESGRELWTDSWPTEFTEPLGGDGPRATPAYNEGRVYFLGALGELRCLAAADGQLLWRANEGTANLTYGVSASPLIVGDRLIVVRDNAIAYNKTNGVRIWAFTKEPPAYSSPMLATFGGQRQLLLVGKTRAMGLSMEDGKLLWDFPWIVLQGNRNIAQPLLLSSNRFFLSAGYGTGCAAIEVTPAGARELWRNKNLKNKFTSSVFWQNQIYGLDEDMLACLDADTGKRKWKDGRYGYGQLLLASGYLVILCGNGDLAFVKAIPDSHQEVLRIPGIEGKTWNHPALEHGKLLVRNASEMACFLIGQ